MLTRKLTGLVAPEGLLLVAAVALVHWSATIHAAQPALRLLPVVVLVAGALLGWRFQRGRLLLALCGLALADRALLWLAPFDSGGTHAGPVVVRTLALVVPAALAALSFTSERAPLSEAGIRRLGVLLLLVGAVLGAWLLSGWDAGTLNVILDLSPRADAPLAWLPLGRTATGGALAAIAVLVGRTLWRGDAESRGFLWAAVAVLVALGMAADRGGATPYLACAGLVLVVATVESAYALAYHDELTGLPARRALNEALAQVNGTYTVAMVDVDHFKQFNDTHGHDVGDQVLRMVAGRLARAPGGGRAFRYGGEEFALLYAGKSAEESAPHLESLCASVADATFTQRGPGRPRRKPRTARTRAATTRTLAVTVSIGAAQARGALLPEDVVRAADKALYRAKEGGRNRVAM